LSLEDDHQEGEHDGGHQQGNSMIQKQIMTRLQ